MAEIPQDLRYAPTHEWARIEGTLCTVGITAHAVEQLTDITYLDLPEPGRNATAGQPFGEIESVKAVATLNAPVSGAIAEVNRTLAARLDALSRSPYGEGWFVRIRMADPTEARALLDADGYRRLLGKGGGH